MMTKDDKRQNAWLKRAPQLVNKQSFILKQEPWPAVPLFIGGTRLLAGRTPSVGFQTLIFVLRENNTL